MRIFNKNRIVGIISPLGATVFGQADGSAKLIFRLTNWYLNDNKIQCIDLRVINLFMNSADANSFNKFKADSIVEFYFDGDIDSGIISIKKIKKYTKNSDVLLSDVLKEILSVKKFTHNNYGEFIFDRRLNWFSAKIKWIDEYVELNVKGKTKEEANVILIEFDKIYENRYEIDMNAKLFSASKLLDIYNKNWNENDMDETENGFASHLEPYAITFIDLNNYELYFRDDFMFYGHDVRVLVNLEKGFIESDF